MPSILLRVEPRNAGETPDPAPEELPVSVVPRWLAALVLLALLASAVLTAWLVLSDSVARPEGEPTPPTAEGPAAP